MSITRDDILNATDEQLDRWCAELRGLRWYKAPHPIGHPLAIRGLLPQAEADDDLIPCLPADMGLPLAGDAYRYVTRHPTTDPAAAWELLTFMCRPPYRCGWDFWADDKQAFATIANEGGLTYEHTEPRPYDEGLRRACCIVACILALETGRLSATNTPAIPDSSTGDSHGV